MDRIGGRAWTSDRHFGVPFDIGCDFASLCRSNCQRQTRGEIARMPTEHGRGWHPLTAFLSDPAKNPGTIRERATGTLAGTHKLLFRFRPRGSVEKRREKS
ncbi:hypothetical protein [Mesorhizobium humile]|jgi:hypothetical protein|uniref:hypothetical protein n=1 Tax=Mesorhizobium humile TaxID=3072313 RepID=UPI003D321C4D